MAKANPFRFSTKYQDDESDLIYYGFRYYNPCTGRWLSRDPIGEKGGLNPHGFAVNSPVNKCDKDGRDIYIVQRKAGSSGLDPINYWHMAVCVDRWGPDGTKLGRECFSFRRPPNSWGFYGPRLTWLGFKYPLLASCLKGVIYRDYETETVGTVLGTAWPTTHRQDDAWERYMTTKRVGTKDAYRLDTHNCLTYSPLEWADADNHFGPP